MKKIRVEKDYNAKNNPSFCRCRAHLQEVNQVNSYIQSLSKKHLDLDQSS